MTATARFPQPAASTKRPGRTPRAPSTTRYSAKRKWKRRVGAGRLNDEAPQVGTMKLATTSTIASEATSRVVRAEAEKGAGPAQDERRQQPHQGSAQHRTGCTHDGILPPIALALVMKREAGAPSRQANLSTGPGCPRAWPGGWRSARTRVPPAAAPRSAPAGAAARPSGRAIVSPRSSAPRTTRSDQVIGRNSETQRTRLRELLGGEEHVAEERRQRAQEEVDRVAALEVEDERRGEDAQPGRRQQRQRARRAPARRGSRRAAARRTPAWRTSR